MFKPHHGQCKDCPKGVIKLLVVKAELCKYHNHKRKAEEKGIEKITEENIIRNYKLKVRVKKISDKKKKILAEKTKMYKKFDERMIKAEKIYCTGCGQHNHLSHSHLVPVSFNASLETEIKNITYHCILSDSGNKSCHDIWETHDPEEMKKLLDYEVNIARIKSLDKKYYLLLTNKTVKQ